LEISESNNNSAAIPIPEVEPATPVKLLGAKNSSGTSNSNRVSDNIVARRNSASLDIQQNHTLTQYPSFSSSSDSSRNFYKPTSNPNETIGIASNSKTSGRQIARVRAGSSGKISVGKPPSHPGERDYSSYSPSSYSPSSFTPVFPLIDNSSVTSPNFLLVAQQQQQQIQSNQVTYYLPGLSGFLIDEGLFGISPPFPHPSSNLLSTSPMNAAAMQQMISNYRRTLSDRHAVWETYTLLSVLTFMAGSENCPRH